MREKTSRFGNRQAQIAAASAATLFLLISLATVAHGEAVVFYSMIAAASLALLARSVLAPSLQVTDNEVTMRWVFRTRHLPLVQIERAEIATGMTGMAAPNRSFLRLRLIDGTLYDFTELNAARRRADQSAVAQAAEAVNDRLTPRG